MKIPTPTLIMLQASKIVQDWTWLVALVVVGGAILFRTYTRTVAGRLWWDDARLRIPILGDALRKAETSRFARAMSTLVGNTVPLVQSLGIAAGILNNKRMANSLREVAQGVKREAETLARTQLERLLSTMDVVTREEFEAVKAMATKAREENERLAARIAELEARLSGRAVG